MENLSLNKQIHEALIETDVINKEIKKYAEKIVLDCSKANSEASIAQRFEESLRDLLKLFNFDYKPIKEETIQIVDSNSSRRIINYQKSGRIDSRFNNIITEYKVDINKNLEDNIEQLDNYINSLSITNNKNIDKYFGILTDGRSLIFISYSSGKKVYSTTPLAVTSMTIKELIKIFLSLGKKELSEKNLVEDFSITKESSVSLLLAKTLYTNIMEKNQFSYVKEWENLFKLGGHNDNNSNSIKARKKTLSELFGDYNIDETAALFSLQTTYTIIIKLIAYNVMSEIYFKSNKYTLKFSDILRYENHSFRNAINDIDSGYIFDMVGLKNLIEKDFYSWYLSDDIWNNEIENNIKNVVKLLAQYDTVQRTFNRLNVHDFFKQLYQSIIPKEVRHSLGEYYTPDWLADHVISNKINELQKEKPGHWTGLDPCCGSGTFVMKLLEYALQEEYNPEENLQNLINRIQGFDINPLAVLTCKINYFLAISRYLDSEQRITINIPIRLGDSALIPYYSTQNQVTTVNYEVALNNEKTIKFSLPLSVIKNKEFYNNYKRYTSIITSKETTNNQLNKLLMNSEEIHDDNITTIVQEFTNNARLLIREGCSTYWLDTCFSIMSTMSLGKFDFIASNPPWIDWKALPDGYRNVLKKASIEQHVFSGDKFTGGINLNICALIANVTADNWLAKNGIAGILMPKSIVFQQTYTGFRNLIQTRSENLIFDEFIDWEKSGNPFHPVTEKFMTFYLKKGVKKHTFVPVIAMNIKKRNSVRDKKYKNYIDVKSKFDVLNMVAFQASDTFNNFTFVYKNKHNVEAMKKIAGSSFYKGRVGLGIYPKEALMFTITDERSIDSIYKDKIVMATNYQSSKSERKVVKRTTFLEKDYLYPVIEGPNIDKFKIQNVKYYAALPYTKKDVKKPIPSSELIISAPNLVKYYNNIQDDIIKTEYNSRVQGKKGEFYSLTRVGTYTFSPVKVVFRNNTKWGAAVVENISTIFGEDKPPLLLDHACSISQNIHRENITLDEAHYICAIMNSSIVNEYIIGSSDKRSFKTDLPLNIVKYNPNDSTHSKLSILSKKAHELEDNDFIIKEIDSLVLEYIKNI
ncbi:Eco57I restriction-modification methylase domain-containing protein [Staphylococcus xylosus]|uniref:Eco57I restriction-modification methylase domain-containing protein n=1 Tax=Staphylococcus xylosus TaxID=1288 RepID=UPI000D1D251B|nr:hypothetical protein [Staphylococcus xylosus]PTH96948.1 hypothetical protein BU099_12370 [Staphylococcus xylosus]